MRRLLITLFAISVLSMPVRPNTVAAAPMPRPVAHANKTGGAQPAANGPEVGMSIPGLSCLLLIFIGIPVAVEIIKGRRRRRSESYRRVAANRWRIESRMSRLFGLPPGKDQVIGRDQ